MRDADRVLQRIDVGGRRLQLELDGGGKFALDRLQPVDDEDLDRAQADLRNIGGAQWFLIAGFVCIAIHFVFIIIGARLFRVDVSMAAVSSVSAVGGAASAPVAAAYHREELVPISIMLALLGYALGNYLGVATAYFCNLLV